MTRPEIRQHIVEVLDLIQQQTGAPHVDVGDDTCPMNDIGQFDSLLALEATVALEGRLGSELGTAVFRESRTRHLRTVADAVDYLCSLLKIQEVPSGQ